MHGTSKCIIPTYPENLDLRFSRLMEKHPHDKELQRITKQEITLKSRDNARTPMQWDNSKYAGFSTSKPWQKENESYLEINAESQEGVTGSVFEHWACLLRLRKTQKDIFIYGNFELLDAKHDDVFAYTRTFGEQKVIVVCNFRKTHLTWSLPSGVALQQDKVLISNYPNPSLENRSVSLRPFEAFACFVDQNILN